MLELQAITKYVDVLGFFYEDMEPALVQQGRDVLTKMSTTRVTGLLLSILTKDSDKLVKRKSCQTALKNQEGLPIRAPLFERARKAITMS